MMSTRSAARSRNQASPPEGPVAMRTRSRSVDPEANDAAPYKQRARRPASISDLSMVAEEDVEERSNRSSLLSAAIVHSVLKLKSSSRPRARSRQASAAIKPRLIDHRPNAQNSMPGPSPAKRTRQDSEQSGDHGFQQDQRVPDPTRRAAAASGPPHKKQRVNQRVESAESESAGGEESDTEAGEEEELTATEVSNAARIATARAKGVHIPKGRTPWSDRDSAILKRRIERYGCAWAQILELGKWDVARDQGALKDRARNMKVNMLKSGMPLPLNFEYVALGRKEIAAVRLRIPDYQG